MYSDLYKCCYTRLAGLE